MDRYGGALILAATLISCDSRVAPSPTRDKDFHGELNCDFSKEHSIACLSPLGANVTGFGIIYEGQFKVTVKLPHGGIFTGDAFFVTAQKSENDQIKLFHITTRAETLEATCQLAQRIIVDWNLSRKNLDEWKNQVKADPNYAYSFDAMNNTIYPSYSLSIHRSLVDEKPWCLFLDIHWP